MKATRTEKEWFQKISTRSNSNIGDDTPTRKSKESSKGDAYQDLSSLDETDSPITQTGQGFKDVAGMTKLKELVTEAFINVLQNQECAKAFGIMPPNILLYGPAGCGKTFFAKKIAEELGINFIEVIPDDIACQYIHGTQEKIGALFRKAEKKAPTLMFFDEFDAMVHARSVDESNKSFSDETNEFLCQLNNSASKGIFVIAATNHPERIDRAVLRTGRFDEIIYVDMPDEESRKCLFRLELSKLPSSSDIDYDKLASLTNGYNCSDISYIVKVASRKMFNESIKAKEQPYKKICQSVLEDAISKKSSSVTSRDLREFERLRAEFSPRDEESKRSGIGFIA